ncbi:hypothetical protein [Pseudonocardia sp. McavD-2-B]|uniref:hypothetical protein n=1 Tax=Pseudonocardia sp. McavD-2-B TaxID=2954499 RepID=UPI0020973B2D|nr:hypothetical protein [Pseudonocardia sp. McavD-2-B]MCO7195638.1 hypothetical protein [Pseudonocardia sp. McavD-2-B]
MDSVISALVGAAPQLGGAGVLVVVLGLLIRREAQTNERHASELTRVSTAHQAELSALRAEIAALREQVSGLNEMLDAERRARWHAEDSAAKHRRRDDGPVGGPPWRG